MAVMPKKILIVDDDPSVAQGLQEPMNRQSISVFGAPTLDNALYLFNQNRFQVAVVELDFGPLNGLTLVQKWRDHEVEDKRFTGIVMLASSKRSPEEMALAKELGGIEFIDKPVKPIQLLPFLSRALARRDRMEALAEMKGKIAKIQTLQNGTEKAIAALKNELPRLGPQGLMMMIDVYEKGERYEEALAIVGSLLAKDPQDLAMLNRKAVLLMKLGKFKEAKSIMERVDQKAPGHMERTEHMADIYLITDEPDKSVAKMKQLVDMNPDKPDMKFSMFEKLNDAGHNDHAKSFCVETTSPSEVVRFYNNRGVAIAKEGDRFMAIAEYEKALQYFPDHKDNFRILFNIGLAYSAEKNLQSFMKAEEYLQRCLELNPTFSKAQNALMSVQKVLTSSRGKAS